jgi:hypothetical protein
MQTLKDSRLLGGVALTLFVGVLLFGAWRVTSANAGDQAAPPDAEIEEQIRGFEADLIELSQREDRSGPAIWLPMQERHALCDELLGSTSPDVEHSGFVEDTCSSTLRDLREDGDIDNEGVVEPGDVVGVAAG